MEALQSLNPVVVAAVVAAITSLVTLVVTLSTKSLIERQLHIFRLQTEHEYAQRKQIKEVLAKYKVHLIEGCESLNHRLWNLSANFRRGWHKVDDDFFDEENYYFLSFAYRILRVLAWIRIVNRELIFLDTTISSDNDLYLLKYLRTLPQLLQDVDLFRGIPYDSDHQTDHIFRDYLDEMPLILTKEKDVLSFSDFKRKLKSDGKRLMPLFRFIDGLSPEESRLRWDRLHCFHLLLISFLNGYGYDFQYTDKGKMAELLSRQRKCRTYDNFVWILDRGKLTSEREVARTIKAIRQHAYQQV